MHYFTYAELIKDTQAFCRKLPRDLTGVLAIPRSGLIPATVISQELDIPMGSVYYFAENGTFFNAGQRFKWKRRSSDRILLLDDSYYKGSAMNKALDSLRRNPLFERNFRVIPSVIYMHPEGDTKILHHKIVGSPRLFEWNIWGHGIIENALFDLDGVIAIEGDVGDSFDSESYLKQLPYLKPLHVPVRKIKGIVTGRMEVRREITEAWLYEHEVKYGKLTMNPFKTYEERRAYGVGKWKGEVYAEDSAELFVESSWNQSKEIFEIAKKPVFCIDENRMLS